MQTLLETIVDKFSYYFVSFLIIFLSINIFLCNFGQQGNPFLWRQQIYFSSLKPIESTQTLFQKVCIFFSFYIMENPDSVLKNDNDLQILPTSRKLKSSQNWVRPYLIAKTIVNLCIKFPGSPSYC